jgi:hypothetical protein
MTNPELKKIQMPILNDQNDVVWDLEFRSLKFIWHLACLRKAPPAEASCGGQALRRRQVLGF